MKRVKAVLIVGIVVLLAMGFVGCYQGIALDISGAFCINTKYYQSPEEAFLADYDDKYEEIEDITDVTVIRVDEFNSIYVGDVGEKRLLVAQMKTKKESFYYMGNHEVYDLSEGLDDSPELNLSSFPKMKSAIWYSGTIEYAVIDAQFADEVSYEFTKVSLENMPGGEKITLVYRVQS